MPKQYNRLSPDLVYHFLQLFALFLTISAFLVDSPRDIFSGLALIVVAPSNLVTDYIEVGGLGATLLNAGILTFFSLLILKKHEHYFSPNTVLTIMLLAGYAFWGKNIFNSFPILFGLLTYLKQMRDQSQVDIAAGLLGTALSPAVSIVYFYSDEWQVKMTALVLGFFIGFTIVPVFKKVQGYTKGLNLYNMGFAAGLMGIVVDSFITQVLDIPVLFVYSEAQHSMEIFYLLIALFTAALCYGLYIFFHHHYIGIENQKIVVAFNHQNFTLRDTSRIFKFSLYGFLGLLIVKGLNGYLNGPVAGTILIFTGFSMYYYHFNHFLFPALGVLLTYHFFLPDAGVTEQLIAVLFVSTMAPFSKKYGTILGLFSGLLFPVVSKRLNLLHDGINLYNSGFAGGVTVMFLYGIRYCLIQIPLVRNCFLHKKRATKKRKGYFEKKIDIVFDQLKR